MKRILTMLVVIVACGCSAPKSRVKSTLWDKSEIIGYTIELIASDDQFESITLWPDGMATVVLGNRHSIAGPLMTWHYDSSGALIVKHNDYRLSLQNVNVKTNTIEVLRNGQPATYKRTKID